MIYNIIIQKIILYFIDFVNKKDFNIASIISDIKRDKSVDG